jgi:hypothetical protein
VESRPRDADSNPALDAAASSDHRDAALSHRHQFAGRWIADQQVVVFDRVPIVDVEGPFS